VKWPVNSHPAIFSEILKFKLKYMQIYSYYEKEGYTFDEAARKARFQKQKAYQLLQGLNFTPHQAVEFFNVFEAPASSKSIAEDLFFAYYELSHLFTGPTSKWCQLPYPGHPKGCLNFCKKPECPNQAPSVEEFIDLRQPHYLAIHAFDLHAFSKRMLEEHPGWTPKRSRCLLYWQKHVKSILEFEIKQKLEDNQVYTLVPEGIGVNVFRTVLQLGIPIRPDPKCVVYKVGLIGSPLTPTEIDPEIDNQTRLTDFLEAGL